MRPSRAGDEAIPLGNGITGGLLWGEGNLIRLSLDRGDLWDERLPDTLSRPDWTYSKMRALKEQGDHKTNVEMFDVPYDTVPYPTKLPAGRLEIALDPALASKSFKLDLESAEASVDLGDARVTAFYNRTSPFAMMRITGSFRNGCGSAHPARGPRQTRVRPCGLGRMRMWILAAARPQCCAG